MENKYYMYTFTTLYRIHMDSSTPTSTVTFSASYMTKSIDMTGM